MMIDMRSTELYLFPSTNDYLVHLFRSLSHSSLFTSPLHSSDPFPLLSPLFSSFILLSPLSLVPEQAAHAGISFPELVGWMVENAVCEA